MEKCLVEYVRPENSKEGVREPIACFVAKKTEDNFVRIGWSICSSRDRFNKEFGRKIALGRLERRAGRKNAVPMHEVKGYNDSIEEAFRGFRERCAKYFREPIHRIAAV